MQRLQRLGRFLQPADSLVWWLFLVWTAVGFCVLPLGLSVERVREIVPVAELAEALVVVLKYADAIWLLLAACVTYLAVADRESLNAARHSALMVVAVSAVVEWIGASSGFPFGPYAYTSNLGPRLGGTLPLVIPLAWLAVVHGGRYLSAHLPGGNSRLKTAICAGAAALLTDINLEPVAWKIRAYWIWYPYGHPLASDPPDWPPIQNFVSWFLLAALLAALCPAPPSPRPGRLDRPLLVLVLMNFLFLAAHLARIISGR